MKQPTVLDELCQPGALRVEFQPIVRVLAGGVRLYAFEALTRGPRGTTMERPDVLFEYARRKGCEMQVDLLCIAEALSSARLLPGQPRISINVHGSTLGNVPRFAEVLLASALAHGIGPDRLMVEVVEHRAPWGMEPFRAALQVLRSAGVRIAIDDLGVGASNYHLFIEVRPDHVKIDRYVVNGCSGDAYRRAVLHSIVTLSRDCGAVPIAEGVENEADLAAVREAGIDCVQGFLYSKSMPAAAIAAAPFFD